MYSIIIINTKLITMNLILISLLNRLKLDSHCLDPNKINFFHGNFVLVPII